MKRANLNRICLAAVAALALAGFHLQAAEKSAAQAKKAPAVKDSVDRLDAAINDLLPPGSNLETLGGGFVWAEGPVWMGSYLLFSDVPTNRVYKWEENRGVSIFLEPSGYTSREPRGGETGSNGLTRDSRGRLVLCQHGDRRIARLERNGTFTPVAEFYMFRRFNSPNDLVYDRKGNLYFTDPAYGMAADMADPKKELPFQGVFMQAPTGEVKLITDKLTRPNGLAISPNGKTLYVANSDPNQPCIYAFDLQADGSARNGRVFFDATELTKKGLPGLPDGMKIDVKGNLFATGPGGILVINAQGKHLGTIVTGEPTGNCAWGDSGSTLYITANHMLLRIKTHTKGQLP